MPPASHIAIELTVYLVVAFACYGTWLHEREFVWVMVVSMVFAFAVEYMFVTGPPDPSKYTYGDFLIKIGPIPLWVALGWGAIIRAAMVTSDKTGVDWRLRPIVDGMLAANVDLALDPIAEAQGFWSWDPKGPYYGVPYDNFLGWVIIVSSFSLFTRIAFRFVPVGSKGWLGDFLTPVVAAVPAFLMLFVETEACKIAYAAIGETATFILVFSAGMAVVGLKLTSFKQDAPLNPYLLSVPVLMHVLLLVLFLVLGLYERHPGMSMLLPLLAFAGVTAFAWPSLVPLAQLAGRGVQPDEDRA
jgi:hypothetical protein